MSDRIRIEREGAVAAVTLARPEVHDAFDDVMVRELAVAFHELGADGGVRALLLRSTGRSFCAGADLEWMRRMAGQSEAENLHDAGALDDLFRAMATCPKPVVARVQGAAFGGGAGLVAASDLAIASTEAKIAFTEVRLGIVPGIISPYVLRKVTPGVAQALFLTGEVVPAQRALELGLFHRVVPPMDLDGAVDAAIANLLAGSSASHASIKRLVSDVAGRHLSESRAITTRAIADARASDDGKEGMAAFLEKRKPRWAP